MTQWEAPGGIGSSSGGRPTILLQYSDSVGWVFVCTGTGAVGAQDTDDGAHDSFNY